MCLKMKVSKVMFLRDKEKTPRDFFSYFLFLHFIILEYHKSYK